MSSKFSIDVEALRAFIRREVKGFASTELEITRHPGGHSCETWNIRADGHRWILRRPPRAGVQKGASNMGREYRVMSALGGSDVPVPKTIVLCEDPSIIGAPFFIMEEVTGAVIRNEFPENFPSSPERRRAIGKSLVDVLVKIHSVDYRAAGLERHGRPEGFLERNLDLMRRQWDRVKQRPIDDIESVGAYLTANIPRPSGPPSLLHGDYKLDNVMWNLDRNASINAVLDWEVSTIADPLVDLGWLRGFWQEKGRPRPYVAMGQAVQDEGDFLSRDEIVERYAAACGRDVDKLPWFEAFAMWKIAIIMEASYARYLSGNSDDPMFAMLKVVVPGLASAAVEALAEAGLR